MKKDITRKRGKRATRSGLRVRGHRGDPVVRRALVRFAQWYRSHYECPVRVPVYLHPRPHVVTLRGTKAAASFFAPWSRAVEPYIRVATGDYGTLRAERGRDNALASFICSLAHELVHYQQWVTTGNIWERGVALQASAVLRQYEATRARP